MGRSPIVALIMGIIPIVNLYLIYSWWSDLKKASKGSFSPVVNLILCLIPVVNLYFLYKLFSGIESAAKAKGKGEYPLGALGLYIISLLVGIPMLYLFYKTQELLNALE